MENNFIMQMRPFFGKEEKEAICKYMDEDGFLTEFKHTEKFEQEICKITGAKHCIIVNNGTISLTLAAIAVGLKAGDEVIVPNYTMIATPNSVKMIGAVPVFVDVCPRTLVLDLNEVKKKITSKTKAIYLVAANGRYPLEGIELFKSIALEKNLSLIEDAAQGLGSYYPNGRHIGTEGIIGSFSFSMPKIITTGQGGCLVTDDDEMAAKLRKLKDFGRTAGGTDVHDSVGFNFKFTEMQAVIGIEQLKKIDQRVIRKKEIYNLYASQLQDRPEIEMFHNDNRYTTPWFYDCVAKDRDGLKEHLHQNGIGSRVMYPPINAQKAYGYEGNYPVSESVGKNGLWLPSQVQLTDDEVTYICDKIKEFYG